MRRPHIALVAIAAVLGACDGPVPPPPPPPASQVELALALASPGGGPGRPVLATADVANTGSAAIGYTDYCWAGRAGVVFQLLDPSGNAVAWRNELIRPACADILATLGPGGNLRGAWSFEGTLWDLRTWNSYPAPTGRYTLVAQFHWNEDTRIAHVEEARAAFTWEAAAR